MITPIGVIIRVVSRIGIFRSVLVGISLYSPYQYRRKTRSVFIKNLAGAPQNNGGSPLFPKKGGTRPPFCTFRPPFEEKKGIPAEFFKKRVPTKS